MTLIEILVALVAFLMLIAALVALATAGLDTWTAGEERKDAFDRAQRILDQIGEDLRGTFADEAWHLDSGGNAFHHASFVCDSDANKRQRLRFVRAGRLKRIDVDPDIRVRRPGRDLDYTDLWEVAYMMDPDPRKTILHRGVRFFDRSTRGSILNGDELGSGAAALTRQGFKQIDAGVLWLSFRFWTPATNTWALPNEEVWACMNKRHGLPIVAHGAGKCPVCGRDLERGQARPVRRERPAGELMGPSAIWDSSRMSDEEELKRFAFRRNLTMDDPDFCYPEIVQVTVVLESTASETRGTALSEGLYESDTEIRLNSTRGMPDGPDFVKIGSEWIEYSNKSVYGVTARRRGARGTQATSHSVGERARFGETFTTDVRVPAYREAVK